MMIINAFFVLVAFPLSLFFGYVTAQGVLNVLSRRLSISVMLWGGFFTIYNFQLLSWGAQSLSHELLKFSHQFDDAHSQIHRLSKFEEVHKETWWIPGKTSHSLCMILGLIVAFWVRSVAITIPKFGPTTRRLSGVFIGGVLHLLFFLGCLVWWYSVLPRFERNFFVNEHLDFIDGLLLATTHTLSFSIGAFFHYAYYFRSFHKKPEMEILKEYSTYGAILFGLSLFTQTFSNFAGLGATTSYAVYMFSLMPLCFFEPLPNASLYLQFWAAVAGLALSMWVMPSRPFEWLLLQRKDKSVKHNESLRVEWVFLLGATFLCLAVTYLQYFLKEKSSLSSRQKNIKQGPQIRSQSKIDRKTRSQKFPPPFPNGWYKLLDSVELEPGQVKNVSCLGREFAVFRSNDEEKKVYCVDAYCPHLGAHLGISSKVSGKCVVCPFHGWEFEGDSGQCSKIPYADNIPKNAKTKSYLVLEHANLILVWFHADNQPPTYYPPALPEIDNQKFKYGGTWQSEVEMHIQDFAENAADTMHFGTVHSKVSFSLLKDFFYVAHSTKWRMGGGQGLNGDEPTLDNNLNEQGNNHHLSSFSNTAQLHLFTGRKVGAPVTAVVTFIGPGGLVYFRFFTERGQILLLKTFLPTEGLIQKVMDVWYYEPSVPPLMVKFVVGEAQNAFIDDMIIWANKTYSYKALIVKEDGPLQQLRRWYKQFYSPSSRLPLAIQDEDQQQQQHQQQNQHHEHHEHEETGVQKSASYNW